jgi:phosphoribosylamine--glycine ligase
MRVLGIGDTNDLGSLYLDLMGHGHQVRVSIADPEGRDTLGGMVTLTDDWRAELGWIQAAGADGVILFETAAQGEVQDELRRAGFNVIGGSSYGDRLESDRSFGQAAMRAAGMQVAPSWSFTTFDAARAFVQSRPGRYVHKLSGEGFASSRTFVGEMADGRDMLGYLEFHQARWPAGTPLELILMDRLTGVEVGVGGYFDGHRFLQPTCIDWEHKRFFPGDLGELTGEMGTVVSYRGGERLFNETLGRMEEPLRAGGYRGYINVNTIVNADGVWPLEFTCRFGYPGFAILQALHRCDWADIFRLMLAPAGHQGGQRPSFATAGGYAVGVVLTVPPFPDRQGYPSLSKGLPVYLDAELTPADRAHLHLSEVALAADGRLITSGMVGYIMVVTGVGDDVPTARRDAYGRVRKVQVPNLRYRNDIGAAFEEAASALRGWGWFV